MTVTAVERATVREAACVMVMAVALVAVTEEGCATVVRQRA